MNTKAPRSIADRSVTSLKLVSMQSAPFDFTKSSINHLIRNNSFLSMSEDGSKYTEQQKPKLLARLFSHKSNLKPFYLELKELIHPEYRQSVHDDFKMRYESEDEYGLYCHDYRPKEIVLRRYYSELYTLPDIEHYLVLLHYAAKQSSMPQLPQLWLELYSLFTGIMHKKHAVPMIYIDFKEGVNSTMLKQIFSIINAVHVNNKQKETPPLQLVKWCSERIQFPEVSDITLPKIENIDEHAATGGHKSVFNGGDLPDISYESSESIAAPSSPSISILDDFSKPKTAMVGIAVMAATCALGMIAGSNFSWKFDL